MIKVQKSKTDKKLFVTDRQTTDRQMKLRTNTHGCELKIYIISKKSQKQIWIKGPKWPIVQRLRREFTLISIDFSIDFFV